MTDRPIIFSAPMVQALLAGRKTMTRRLATSPLRKVQAGDRLWVREGLTHVTSDPVSAQPCSLHCYTASIPPGMDCANPYEDNYLFPEDGAPNLKPKSLPSIHMPRWASRLTLIVTGSKIERLQDLSETDAIAEGVRRIGSGLPGGVDRFGTGPNFYTVDMPSGGSLNQPTAVETFALLWKMLHGEESWDANPEVVAISFKVHRANVDASAVDFAA